LPYGCGNREKKSVIRERDCEKVMDIDRYKPVIRERDYAEVKGIERGKNL